MKEEEPKICQSCGMPLNKDPYGGGTNLDGTRSSKFCSFCYQKGRFVDEGTTLEEKIVKNTNIAVTRLNMPEDKAREMAEMILSRLDRWK